MQGSSRNPGKRILHLVMSLYKNPDERNSGSWTIRKDGMPPIFYSAPFRTSPRFSPGTSTRRSADTTKHFASTPTGNSVYAPFWNTIPSSGVFRLLFRRSCGAAFQAIRPLTRIAAANAKRCSSRFSVDTRRTAFANPHQNRNLFWTRRWTSPFETMRLFGRFFRLLPGPHDTSILKSRRFPFLKGNSLPRSPMTGAWQSNFSMPPPRSAGIHASLFSFDTFSTGLPRDFAVANPGDDVERRTHGNNA